MRFRRATAADLGAVVRLDLRVLAWRDVVPVEVFAGWQRVNPTAFRVLLEGDRVLGYFSILPLASPALERFLRGELSEHELTGADILPPARAREATDLYFFSIARDPDRPELGEPLVARAWTHLTSRREHPRATRLFATAATPAGRRMLLGLGFAQVVPAAYRKDGHPLFERTVPGAGPS